MKHTKISILIFAICLYLLCPFFVYGEEEELTLYSQSAVLMDADSGRVLYGKNEDIKRPMASTTKIMTCIIALENGNLKDVITASSNAAAQPKVHLGMVRGEQFYLKDLLYALMLESFNDSAVAIAEHIGGDTEGFAALMNKKAKELGCNSTFFITPNGLDAKNVMSDGTELIHSTTAEELARIMKYCLNESPEREKFLEITRTQNYSFTDVQKKHSYSCTNHNALLTMMNGALTGKTGFTGGAGYSYVGALERDGRTYIISLLGCGWPPHKTWKWSDAQKLFKYGIDNYKIRDVFKEQQLEPVLVENGIPDTGDISQSAQVRIDMGISEQEKTLKLLLSEDESVEIVKNIPDKLTAPVKEEQIIGNITYKLNNKNIKIYPVYACKTIERITLKWCIGNVIMRKYLL